MVIVRIVRAVPALVLGIAMLLAGPAWAVTRADAVGKPVVAGLRADITGVLQQPPNVIAVGYRLRWTGAHESWILGPTAPVNVVFWTPRGRRVFADHQVIPLDNAFISGTQSQAMYQIIARVPPGVTRVSLMFGTSGLETAPRKLR